ncbi:hypothetical protein F5X98DRAFT_329854 [Xylaria grammica]|nr:hypothetical protein F5X98DRAFT_329854 [Xylaria grammica]
MYPSDRNNPSASFVLFLFSFPSLRFSLPSFIARKSTRGGEAGGWLCVIHPSLGSRYPSLSRTSKVRCMHYIECPNGLHAPSTSFSSYHIYPICHYINHPQTHTSITVSHRLLTNSCV